MKQTILVCDRCPAPKPFAVTTLVLSNGRRGQNLAVDVCKKHEAEIKRCFLETRKRGVSPLRGRHSKYTNLDEKIMAFVERMKEAQPTPCSKAIKVPRHAVQKAFLDLAAAGKLVRSGKGRQATYRKA